MNHTIRELFRSETSPELRSLHLGPFAAPIPAPDVSRFQFLRQLHQPKKISKVTIGTVVTELKSV